AGFAAHENVAVVAQTSEIAGERGNRSALAATTPNDADQLFDTLPWLLLSPRQLLEDDALRVGERLAHRRDEQHAPREPAITRQDRSEQRLVRESVAQRDCRPHDAASASCCA